MSFSNGLGELGLGEMGGHPVNQKTIDNTLSLSVSYIMFPLSDSLVDEVCGIHAMFLDYRKAFDIVPHGRLIGKLYEDMALKENF